MRLIDADKAKEKLREIVMRGWAAMIHATHWMPIPDAPEAIENGNDGR